MITLTPSTAITLVRKNLDEAGLNESIMYTDENNDNLSLDDIIKKNLPEAINGVHLAAPVTMLEGVEYTFSSGARPEGENIAIVGNTLEFSPSVSSNFLRLVAFRASDSDIVLTDTIDEASAEGRKQLNPYIRGRWDMPRLVRLQGTATPPRFIYYSLKNGSAQTARAAVAEFSFVQEKLYSSVAQGYEISRLLRQNIIDWLTAMVMECYGDQRAQSFQAKATTF